MEKRKPCAKSNFLEAVFTQGCEYYQDNKSTVTAALLIVK